MFFIKFFFKVEGILLLWLEIIIGCDRKFIYFNEFMSCIIKLVLFCIIIIIFFVIKIVEDLIWIIVIVIL